MIIRVTYTDGYQSTFKTAEMFFNHYGIELGNEMIHGKYDNTLELTLENGDAIT